ncbi:histidine triad nucleotide-binding protein [Alicyclobacillus fastidiosus]|uniref:Histidine triad nucleotide-binding protein n=1 Tax=Alicyclobacillus fastidiosus TaxID=392011 RepID=A0ABY6ZGE6_9BACL|nr:histidine triad nucleotide-binding protein [Alicyclobacillus fastidiosus]WAH41195.1 histidine triad nucleotide-binding protein [Alicyclobacillus fastidiosus]
MEDCIFCKIVSGELPSDKVYENDDLLAFQNIRPDTPIHVLVIPKQHIASAHKISDAEASLIGRIHATIPTIAAQLGLGENGYRIVTNIGEHGQQTVPHLHYHILGGRQLIWQH